MRGSRNGAMFLPMVPKRAIILGSIVCLCLGAAAALATPADEQVAAYLKAHKMISLLEVQLEDRIRASKDEAEQSALIEELSDLYLDQLRSFDQDDPYRQIVLNRARSLVARMSSAPMYELRIELAIEGYLGVESSVELAKLELLDSAQRADAIEQLSGLNRELGILVSKLDPQVAQLERLRLRSARMSTPETRIELADLRRFRSLGHYYHAWTGYSLAVLKDQHVPSDVFSSFGWLLGAEGNMPQFSVLNETTLEFEHVARAAIGVALAYTQSDDSLTGRAWAKFVADSAYVTSDVQAAAQDRLLQIMAADRDWIDVYRFALFLEKQRGEETPMRVADARFLALRSLEAMQLGHVGRGGIGEASKVARYAIEQLIEQREIGHVLDLYRRFDSLPLVADSFVTNYASALAALNKAEQAGDSGMYASVAAIFAQALKSPDADRFPDERDDCLLKLAYAEIRSRRAVEAIKVCDQLIKESVNEQVIEEARWMRIAAMDSINTNAGRATSDELDEAVREYIAAYPSTPRSAQLVLRHAMRGTIDSQVAIDTLWSIADDDPIVLPARRALVGLEYQQLRALGFADTVLLGQVLAMVRWIEDAQPDEVVELADARMRMGTIRIGLDLALRASPADIEFADELIAHGMRMMSFDASLGVYRSEFVYRQLELAVLTQRHNDSMDLLAELVLLDPGRAQSARILIFNDSIGQWRAGKDERAARRVVDLGTVLLADQMPAYPEPLGLQVSSIAEMIAEVSGYLWESRSDVESRDLALRVSLLVLDRGQPSEPGLRRTAKLAGVVKDYPHELEAWSVLLAAQTPGEERWYEARYESLRVMKHVDFSRALAAYDQYRVLYPNLGPAPWNEKIAALFGDQAPGSATPAGGAVDRPDDGSADGEVP